MKEGIVKWKSPSNIALVKYWGKHGRQLPSNPSISFTLSNAHTITEIQYQRSDQELVRPSVQFTFEGETKPAFETKIVAYLESIKEDLPLIKQHKFKIASSNSFPHSSGIASSASSMSALALCLLSIEQELHDRENIDFNKASMLARLGSGSASRSVFGPLAIWGDTTISNASSNEYAIPFGESFDPVFNDFHDDILIVSKKEKSVSSTAGHALMENNPYALNRFEQAHKHLEELNQAMTTGDIETFGLIVEKEALTLHALMMASTPPYMLMEPNTISIINEIKEFRTSKYIPVYFTLDAGPNIHMLYPHKYLTEIAKLKQHLSQYCQDGTILDDHVGQGPQKLS